MAQLLSGRPQYKQRSACLQCRRITQQMSLSQCTVLQVASKMPRDLACFHMRLRKRCSNDLAASPHHALKDSDMLVLIPNRKNHCYNRTKTSKPSMMAASFWRSMAVAIPSKGQRRGGGRGRGGEASRFQLFAYFARHRYVTYTQRPRQPNP